MAAQTESAVPPRPSEQVRIQLSTRDPTVELPERTGPILVSTGLGRYALSTLVNNLLEPSAPVPFEFLVNGQFLRTSLSQYLTNAGISAESTVHLEYIRALVPPTQSTTFEHDDWVSSVDVLSSSSPAAVYTSTEIPSGQERILSGSYDGLLRVWNTSGQVMTTSTPTYDAAIPSILAARFVTPSLVASAGWDARVRFWHYTDTTDDLSSKPSLRPALDGYGHTMAVTHIAAHAPSQRLLSASNDGTARLWSTDVTSSTLPSAPPTLLFPSSTSSKRRKTTTTTPSTQTCTSLSTLTPSTRPITSAIFSPHDPTAAYTTSLDRTLTTHDLLTSRAISRHHPSPHAGLSALVALPHPRLLAVGTAARSILLVDPRAGSSATGSLGVNAAVAGRLAGHAGAVLALAAEPSQSSSAPDAPTADAAVHMAGAGGGGGYALASGGADGTVRVWDVRNASSSSFSTSSSSSAPASSFAGGTSTNDGLSEGGRASYTLHASRSGKSKSRIKGKGEAQKVFDLHWDATLGLVSGGEDGGVSVCRV